MSADDENYKEELMQLLTGTHWSQLLPGDAVTPLEPKP